MTPKCDFFDPKSGFDVVSKSQGGPGSVRFGYSLGVERFERFRFSTVKEERTVPVSVPGKRFRRFAAVPVPLSVSENGSDGSGFRFRSGS